MQAPFSPIRTSPHVQTTSTGTGDVKTVSPGDGAKAFFYTLQTNGAYVTFDGSTPSSTNGLHFPAGTAPMFIPIGKAISFASDTAASAVLSVMWCQ